MAEAFAGAGWQVWVTDVDDGALAACPEDWQLRQADARDEAAMADVVSSMPRIDALCANAGIAGPTARIEDIAIEDWRGCVGVNLEGAFLAAKHAAPRMKAAGSGAIVLTSSTAGLYGYPNRAPYAAAKWGVIGLMKTLAMELGPFGIRANAICPGAVEGPRMEGVLTREAAAKGMTRDAVYAGYAAGTSMRTFVEARDVGEMALFLCSDAARRVSGQAIAVDGHTENPDPKSG
ncbi:SDR family oxidoreductase [Sulfitobacter sp. D35]|uniref:SDR family oxidoreductase n=1 Tax=Sulfitobacter sp. D35 TaxID=3083252 RepID=UPI003990AE50